MPKRLVGRRDHLDGQALGGDGHRRAPCRSTTRDDVGQLREPVERRAVAHDDGEPVRELGAAARVAGGNAAERGGQPLQQRARPVEEQPARDAGAPRWRARRTSSGASALAQLGHLRELARLDELAQARLDARARRRASSRARPSRTSGATATGNGADPLGRAPVRADRVAGRPGRVEQRREPLQRARRSLLVVGSGHVQSLPATYVSPHRARPSSFPTARDAKRRLPGSMRAAVAVAMLGDVVDGVHRGRPDARRDRRHRASCRRAPSAVADPGGGQGAAVAAALAAVEGHALVVNADVPARSDDLRRFAGSRAAGARARRRGRTGRRTRSRCPIRSLFAPLYGPGSAARFLGAGAVRVARPSRSSPTTSTRAADLERVAPRAGPRTRAVLALR